MAQTPKVSFKEINKIAIPAIIAGIAEPLISLTDIAVIGNVEENSVEALAAAGIVGSFLSAIIWIVAQTKTAISAIVSQHLGANRVHAVKTLIPQAIVFNLILSLVIYATTAFFAESIFSAYNADGLILKYTEDYYTIRAIGYPLTLVTFAIFGIFRGLQNTLWAMKCSLAGAAVNIGLDYALVYGIEGFIEPLHLKGAAYASLAAQATMLVMAFYFFFKKTPFHLKLSFNINPQMKPLLLMAANLFVRTAALNFAIYLANAYATDYGKNYIAAQSILMNIWLFFSFFIDGYANAGNAIGGRLLGAKDYVRLWNLSKDICKYAVFIAFILMGICALFYNEIGQVFNKEAIVLALLRLIVKPILIIFTLPITIITFGIFLLFINAIIILIADYFVGGFAVDGIWWALIFSLLLSLFQSMLFALIKED
ncbi:MATE family efflux transporter [Mesonia mobilis]|uniref:MATE family efflux transporter n=1 Tax=Mesonia mobilis TaxID=369791 RepID=UPI0026EE9567|nr:MATE family efflux transporter [Mesonia mobilis]